MSKIELNLESKKDLYINGAKSILPLIKLSSLLSFGDPKNITSAEIELSTRNELIEPFIDSDKTSKFIHYTDIHSFCEIINSKHFRMYNCDNLNDPKEIEYGLKKFDLTLTAKQIEQYKRSHFVFSSCKYNDDNSDDFNMWRFYGNNGNGVGIVFSLEFDNDDYQSEGIYVGDVNYGTKDDKFYRFKKFIEYHKKFNSDYNLFKNIPNLFPLISGFFKDDIWKIENESRIFTHCKINENGVDEIYLNFNIYLKETIESSINKNGKKVFYMKLPLKSISQNEENLAEHNKLPKIKIEKVILGYVLPESTKNLVDDFINMNFYKKYGYQITIENSKIFND